MARCARPAIASERFAHEQRAALLAQRRRAQEHFLSHGVARAWDTENKGVVAIQSERKIEKARQADGMKQFRAKVMSRAGAIGLSEVISAAVGERHVNVKMAVVRIARERHLAGHRHHFGWHDEIGL